MGYTVHVILLKLITLTISELYTAA